MSRFKRFRVPHVFVLLSLVILVCAAATWVVPSGEYRRETREVGGTTRSLVVPGTFAPMPKHISLGGVALGEDVPGQATPVGLMGVLTAIPRGMEAAADIIFFIFIIGGTFGILQRTGVITASLNQLLGGLGHRAAWLTVALMVVMAAGGSTLGMGEEFIPLIPVFLLVSQRLGYDRIYGMALVFVFLFLAAQYESWATPLSVMLTVPVALLGAVAGATLVDEQYVAIATQRLEGATDRQVELDRPLAGPARDRHDGIGRRAQVERRHHGDANRELR